MLLFHVAFWPLPIKECRVEKSPAMVKKGVSRIHWGMYAMILVPSLNIIQLFWSLLFPPWNETPGNKSEAALGLGYKIPASPFEFLSATQPNPFGKVFKPICLTLLPISFKHQPQLNQPPASVLLLKAVRFTFPLFWLKTKDFSLLLFSHLLETCPAFSTQEVCVPCLLKGLFPRQNIATVTHFLLHLGLFSGTWSLIKINECFRRDIKLGYRWRLVYGCLYF